MPPTGAPAAGPAGRAHVATRACSRSAWAAVSRPRVSRWKRSRGHRCWCVARPLASPALLRSRGPSDGPLDWILEPLRTQGFAFLELAADEQPLVDALFRQSRAFFSRPTKEKESFKVYPLKGGYLTPYPGACELFELRRGLSACPPELADDGMAAFRLFETLARRVGAEIERDTGVAVASLCGEDSATMRCIHYDRPLESTGQADAAIAPSDVLPAGAMVRVVSEAALSGAVGEVVDASPQGVTVAPRGVPPAVAAVSGERVALPWHHVRKIERGVPGMYPAHTDSSLITVAPRSTASGLEAKDLHTGAWFPIEDLMRPTDCLVFVGDPLDYATAHRYAALMHRPALYHGSRDVAKNAGHRVSTPFFLYPREAAVIAPTDLPNIKFEHLQCNVKNCRDRFPWKRSSCYYSDLKYSMSEAEAEA